MPRYQESISLRYSDIDFHGRASIVAFARLFQEVAGKHADLLGFGSGKLRERGVTWVLGKFQIKLLTEARWKDSVEIETWTPGVQRNFALRDYRARGPGGVLLAEASSYWAMFDLESRQAVPIPEDLRLNYPSEPERVEFKSSGRLAWKEELKAHGAREYEVRLSEIDENRHVTNTAYASWALDAVDSEFATEKVCRELSIVFRSEALLGERVISEHQSVRENLPTKTSFLHRVRRISDGQDLALCQSAWESF